MLFDRQSDLEFFKHPSTWNAFRSVAGIEPASTVFKTAAYPISYTSDGIRTRNTKIINLLLYPIELLNPTTSSRQVHGFAMLTVPEG